jgi:hypothetical protein
MRTWPDKRVQRKNFFSLEEKQNRLVVSSTGTLKQLEAEWFAAMRRADFDSAWRASDGILALRRPDQRDWGAPRHEQWIWDGRPLAGQRVLVRCYHGLGDTLQFARFLPALSRLTAATVVWAQAPLIPLLETLPRAGSMQFLPLHDGAPEADYDVDLEVMELGHALRVRAGEVGALVPYFGVPAAERIAERFSIGIVLASGDWDSRRSLPRGLLEGVAAVVPTVELCSLQLDPPLPGVRDLSTPHVLELARRLRALDLVITPDTMLAHLAGALGMPTWTLLPADADWRWLGPERSRSPWYPSMRLFRQSRAGDWQPVLDAVIARLSSVVR